jgi:hypothetical protein
MSGHLIGADNAITGFTLDKSGRRLLWVELLALMTGWQFDWLGENVAAPATEDNEASPKHPYVVMSRDEESIRLDKDELDKLIDKMCGFFNVELACK